MAAGGSDEFAVALVFLVRGDVADAGVESDRVVVGALVLKFGSQDVDVFDEFDVGLFGFEVAEQ